MMQQRKPSIGPMKSYLPARKVPIPVETAAERVREKDDRFLRSGNGIAVPVLSYYITDQFGVLVPKSISNRDPNRPFDTTVLNRLDIRGGKTIQQSMIAAKLRRGYMENTRLAVNP